MMTAKPKRRIGLIAAFRPTRRSITVLSAALVILIASLTFTRRADPTLTAPADWGSNDTATRMSGTVAGDFLITSGIAGFASRKVPFRISVDGEKWSARVDFQTNYYEVAGFDGSKSGMVLVDPKPEPVQSEHKNCAAEIYGSSYPAGADTGIRLAWLGFAAAPFFRSTNSSDFTALWGAGLFDPGAHAIRISKVEFIPGSPDLPSTVDMVVSTQTVLRDVTNVPNLSPFVSPQVVKEAVRSLRRYDNRLCARYQVLSTTNFQGKKFPATFELVVFNLPRFSGRAVTYHGTVREITTAIPRSFLPNLGWAFTAQDYRLVDRIRRIDRIWTRVSDGIWPEKDDPELQETFRRLQTEHQGIDEKTPYPDATSFYGKNTVGRKPEIQFTALDGREVDLAKLKGKVVLLDFWATWCGPCVVGIPELQEVYGKFHARGLEVVAISLDTDRTALEWFVKEKGLPWPQYFDGKRWNNTIAAKYGIHAVPTLWLVGRDGKVVDQDLRSDLTEKVTKLMAEQ
jgi:thiol-disulfide isomerase/thioredoxin